jgi:hypothetical protein
VRLLLPILLACSGGDPAVAPPEVYPEAAAQTTFASAEALGSYVLEAHLDVTTTRESGTPTVISELTRLSWQSSDRWQWLEMRDGKRVSEVRVWEGAAWRCGGSGVFRKLISDASASADLTTSGDPWSRALGTAADRVGYRDAGEEDIEGRKVWHYRLGLLPSGTPGRKVRDVSRVEGQVWIDQQTAVRLAGDLTVDTTFRSQQKSAHLRFAMSRLGGDAGVEPPPSEARP